MRASTPSTASTRTTIAPFVTWGTSPDQAIAIDQPHSRCSRASDTRSRRIALRARSTTSGSTPVSRSRARAIDRVFIGSCTNGRIEDLRIVAAIVRGQATLQKACARWSCRARAACAAQAEAEGIAATLIDAGFEWREPGCSMCLAMNDDVLEAGERCASTTNRNFEGRQGRGGRTHLMSPAMAAAAALTGRITDVRTLEEHAS